MIDKTIQKIRATIIFIFCILIYFFFMETIFFLTHLIGRNFWWILVNENVRAFEKTQVEEDLSFPPLEVGSLKAKRLVEISNMLIWFLLCKLHMLNLLKIVGANTIIIVISLRISEVDDLASVDYQWWWKACKKQTQSKRRPEMTGQTPSDGKVSLTRMEFRMFGNQVSGKFLPSSGLDQSFI